MQAPVLISEAVHLEFTVFLQNKDQLGKNKQLKTGKPLLEIPHLTNQNQPGKIYPR
jgi:hypothetical protein